VGPLSQKNATIIGATENPACYPFLAPTQCNLGSHEVRHEILYLPNCPVGLIGSNLLCKLRAQITFDSNGMATLQLRGPKTRVLTLTVTEEEEWPLCAPKGRPPETPELSFKILGVWAEDNPQVWPKMFPQ
jgi:hypothetical protein